MTSIRAEPAAAVLYCGFIKRYECANHGHISKHYDQDIRQEQLEHKAGIGRNHIIRQFRRIYGVTPIHYLTLVRIEQVKSLAIQTNLSVSESSVKVGYSEVHTFGRAFKRVTGISLSQYCTAPCSFKQYSYLFKPHCI
jgi:AraC-like DNA-binding protein